jgi:predicted O-methyltransferase YrrM
LTNYIFEGNRADWELERLRLIERALDQASLASLQRTGVSAGWHCLELGAGAGSIAQWMAGMVGWQGRVVAMDKNTDHIQNILGSPYDIVKGDFLDIAIDESFDLAHCRYVLIHNQQSDEMLTKLCSLLRPGGFLVVEEPDFTSAKLLNRSGDPSQQRVNNAICRMFEELQLDPAYGLTLPEKVADAGLQTTHVDAHLHLNRGGNTLSTMMGQSTCALADRYVATGEASRTDILSYLERSADPLLWSVYYATITVIARKDAGRC